MKAAPGTIMTSAEKTSHTTALPQVIVADRQLIVCQESGRW